METVTRHKQAAITVGQIIFRPPEKLFSGVNYLFFSEEHSHATEQKLKDDIDRAAAETDRSYLSRMK